MRVLITGASGLLGRKLSTMFESRGDEVLKLSHRRREGAMYWDPVAGVFEDMNRLEGLDAVVHLAGENISGRWTASKKDRMFSSRVGSSKFLCDTLLRLKSLPPVVIGASAVGYYGVNSGEVNEGSALGEGYLADLCAQWESAYAGLSVEGVRVVHARLGVIFSMSGGALAQMLPLFRLGLGGRLGGGAQRMSWIALQDAVRAFEFCMDEGVSGAVNFATAEAVSNRVYTAILSAVLGRPACLPVPACVLRAVLGGLADEVLLSDVAAKPSVLLSRGFKFDYPDIEGCLRAHIEGGYS